MESTDPFYMYIHIYVVKAEKRRDAVNPKIDAARSRRKSRPLFKHRVADNKKNKYTFKYPNKNSIFI
jgi:hypothetical protein